MGYSFGLSPLRPAHVADRFSRLHLVSFLSPRDPQGRVSVPTRRSADLVTAPRVPDLCRIVLTRGHDQRSVRAEGRTSDLFSVPPVVSAPLVTTLRPALRRCQVKIRDELPHGGGAGGRRRVSSDVWFGAD